jgi:hypothetical protein
MRAVILNRLNDCRCKFNELTSLLPDRPIRVAPAIVLLPFVPRFPLMSNGEDEYCVDSRNVAIEGNKTSGTAPDNQFPHICSIGSPNQGAVLQYRDSLNDVGDAVLRVSNLVPLQMIDNPVEIVTDLGC